MQIFIYEFVTGGGLWSCPDWGEPSGSLLEEGRAMLLAIAADFATLPDVSVVVTRDSRIDLPELTNVQIESVNNAAEAKQRFGALAAESDKTLIISPEIDNELANCCATALKSGGSLLGADLEFVRLASDKHATVEVLAAADIPVPVSTIASSPGPIDLAGPFIVKPRLGAGSIDVRAIESIDELSEKERSVDYCVQAFVGGHAASVAAICGPNSRVFLPPCWQEFVPGTLEYAGGSLISDARKIERAERLARRVVTALPKPRGYLGIDMILGASDSGADDYAIEVNPRLTTSYVGLRAALSVNLAEVLMRNHSGQSVIVPAPNHSIRYYANGRVVLQ